MNASTMICRKAPSNYQIDEKSLALPFINTGSVIFTKPNKSSRFACCADILSGSGARSISKPEQRQWPVDR